MEFVFFFSWPESHHTVADKTSRPMIGRHRGQAANKETDLSKSILTLILFFSYFMSEVIHILARCLFLDPRIVFILIGRSF